MVGLYFFTALILIIIMGIITDIIKVLMKSRKTSKSEEIHWGKIIGCVVALVFLISLGVLVITFSIEIQYI